MGNGIKRVGKIVCLMAAAMMIITSCSKPSYNNILGTWTLEEDPSCRWTFLKKDLDYICSIMVGDYKRSYIFSIQENTLILKVKNSDYDYDAAYLSIDEFSNKRMRISGTIRFRFSNSPDEYRDIDYSFRKQL